jgi:UPF0716 protein FxsA
MSLVKWIFAGLLLLPAAEIAVFVLVAMLIGWFWTIALFLATSAVGVWLLRRSGRDNLARFAAALQHDGVRAIHLESPGFASVLGGILLVFPGFITDAVGALLFVPPLRRWAAARLGRALRARRRGRSDTSVVELTPGEWHQISETAIEDAASPKRRRRVGRKREP